MENLEWIAIKKTKKSLKEVPTTTGVYIYKQGIKPIYIGKSVNLKARLFSHYQNSKLDRKEAAIQENTTSIEYTITDNEFKALLLESKLIQQHQPIYNRIWKDDKSYLYICITDEEFPKVFPIRKSDIKLNKSHTYIGPFPSSSVVDDVLASIRRVIPFCTRQNLGSRACFYSKIGLCNPCPSKISKMTNKAEKSKHKRLYRKNIRSVKAILEGNTVSIVNEYHKEIKRLSEIENYELALKLRNKISRFEHYITLHAFSDQRHFKYDQSDSQLQSLKSTLQPFFPKLKSLNRIECYDASTLQLTNSTASMVVLTDGLIDKSQYRRFKIKSNARSDFDMLFEALSRRFKNKWPDPDLVVIDGGKPQLRKLQQVLDKLNKNIPLVGIAKNPDRLIIANNMKVLNLESSDLGFNLIKLIRDESHRFANTYHLKLRRK